MAIFAGEVPVSPPVLTTHFGASDAAVATDGLDFLIVWTSSGGVSYARVGRGPEVLDVPARLLSAGGFAPKVVFAHGRYLVVWQEWNQLGCAFLDRDGNVVRTFTLGAGAGSEWGIAAEDDRFLVAWTSGYEKGTAEILSADGDVLVTVAVPFQIAAACASTGSFVLLSPSEIFDCAPYPTCSSHNTLLRLSSDGHEIARFPFDNIGVVERPVGWSIASGSDGGVLLTYAIRESVATYTLHIRGMLLDYSLHPVIPAIDHAAMSAFEQTATLWDGLHYLVVFHDQDHVLSLLRFGIDTEPVGVWPGEAGVVVPDGPGYFVVNTADGIRASFRDDLTMPPDAAVDVRSIDGQGSPSVATDGHSVLAGWYDDEPQAPRVAWIAPGSSRLMGSGGGPAVSFDGSDYLVLDWSRASFLSRDGTPADSVQLEGGAPIWTGKMFFVFTYRDPYVWTTMDVTRLSRSGTAIGSVTLDSRSPYIVSKATNGRDAFLLMMEGPSPPFLVRVSEEGAVTTGDARTILLDNPQVAAAGDVVYVTGILRDATRRLAIDTYTTDLKRRWAVPVALTEDTPQGSAVAADGNSVVVVWRNGQRIDGTTVTAEGNLAPFTLGELGGYVTDVSVAAAAGRIAVGYTRIAPEEPYRGALRMFVQPLWPPRIRVGPR